MKIFGGTMLTFEEKLAIIEDFPQLTRKDVSLKRVNFQYEGSVTDKKNVVFHLHPNGNGFVYVGLLTGYERDEKGMVNIKNFTEKALRSVIEKSISSLSGQEGESYENETWVNENDFTLVLIHEHELFNVYAGELLDGTFTSYPEACDYLMQEGFTRKLN